jgi:tRNA pseudouridine55 synthase
MEWAPPLLDLIIRCGRGFYVRSLAHDLGQALGSGGHLKTLVRLRAGPFTIADALDLEAAVRKFAEGAWQDYLHSPDKVVAHLPVAVVGRRLEGMIQNGRAVPASSAIPLVSTGRQCRVYGIDGRFIAILSFDATLGQWQPDRVFSINATD